MINMVNIEDLVQKREVQKIIDNLVKEKVAWRREENEHSIVKWPIPNIKEMSYKERYDFVAEDFDPDLAFWCGNSDAQALLDYLPEEEIERLRTTNSGRISYFVQMYGDKTLQKEETFAENTAGKSSARRAIFTAATLIAAAIFGGLTYKLIEALDDKPPTIHSFDYKNGHIYADIDDFDPGDYISSLEFKITNKTTGEILYSEKFNPNVPKINFEKNITDILEEKDYWPDIYSLEIKAKDSYGKETYLKKPVEVLFLREVPPVIYKYNIDINRATGDVWFDVGAFDKNGNGKDIIFFAIEKPATYGYIGTVHNKNKTLYWNGKLHAKFEPEEFNKSLELYIKAFDEKGNYADLLVPFTIDQSKALI